MSILEAIILGIVEGLTEFIPVSSTGHLIIASRFLGVAQTEFLKTFEIAIQSGAILAVLPLFIRRIYANPSTLINVIAAFIPTALVGVIFHSAIKNFFESYIIVSVSLIIGGIIIIAVESLTKNKATGRTPINLKESVILGCFQALAVIPGVSRSGATIIGGLLRGLNRVDIVEFSFLLSIPTIMGAGVFDLIKSPIVLTQHETMLILIGGLSAWISGVICVSAFLRFISTNSFVAFGWYRIGAGLLFLFIFSR